MRSLRAKSVLAVGWAVIAVLVGACSFRADDVVVDANAGAGAGADQVTGAVTNQADALLAPDPTAVQDATQLQTDGEAGAAEPRPGPPTLSPDSEAALATSTEAPTTTESSSSTDASTTTSSSADDSTSSTNRPPGDGSIDPPSEEELVAGEEQSLNLLNELRSELGVAPLTRDADMDTRAREWSKHMAETGEFAHNPGPFGENIAFTSNTALTAAQAAEMFHQLWVDSPEHYSNMSNDRYSKVGIGLYLTDRGWYGTHVFQF